MLNRSHLVALAFVAACTTPDVTIAKPPSCVGLAETCGSGGNDSSCNSPLVTGGTYDRRDSSGISSGTTSYPVTVSDFRLDKYEVTVGRFRAFVNAGMGTQTSAPLPGAGAHANIAGSGWDAAWNASLATDQAALVAAVKCDATYQMWTDTPDANEDRPMNCITWYEAMAFCAWDGGYLPTEAEWHYAATGGDEQRVYPWSSPPSSKTLDGSHASYQHVDDCVGDGMAGCAVTDLVAVGTKPAGDGRWGQSDLAGNVWECTLDWFAPYEGECTDCADLTPNRSSPPASKRVVRGGNFNDTEIYLVADFRYYVYPDFRDRDRRNGIRCARAQ